MHERQPPTGIIYCRVSFSDQVEGTSLESQERICREYAERQGIEVLEVFVERGESAKTAKRTELNRALVVCKRRKVRYFIVYKLDRFARNQDDHVTVRAMLRQGGTELRSVTEPIDESPIGRMMEGVLSAFAQFDNDVRTERTKQGMMERVKQGVWVWQAPLGYLNPGRGENIVLDPEKAPLVRLIFAEYAKGIYSFKRLADLIASRGLRSRYGGLLTGQQLRLIVMNPAYAGIIAVWGQQFEGKFQPLVSRELFAACEQVRQLATKSQPAPAPRSLTNPNFPLRSFIVCSSCGKTLTGSSPRGHRRQRYPYYHHYNRDCPAARNIPKALLEESFVDLLEDLSIRPGVIEQFTAHVTERVRGVRDEIRTHNAGVRRDITLLEHERQAIFDLHRRGVYSDEDLAEQKAIFDKRINEKRLLLKEEDVEIEIEQALEACLPFLVRPNETWLELKPRFQRRLEYQKLLIPDRMTFDGERLRTTRIPLVYRLCGASGGSKDGLVPPLADVWNELLAELRKWRAFAESLSTDDP